MVEFKGEIAKEYVFLLQKQEKIKSHIMGVAIVFVCSIWSIILFFLHDKEFLYFLVITLLMVILTVIDFLPMSKSRQKKLFNMHREISIKIYDGNITNTNFYNQISKPISKVKKVIDVGGFYRVVFKFGAGNYWICQKDLLVQGTIEEFENYFEGKIVRKIKNN